MANDFDPPPSAAATLRVAAMTASAGALAHALGTPLNVILGRVSMIEAAPDAGEQVSKHAAIVAAQTRRMVAMIEGLLHTIERCAAAHPEPVDVSALLQATIDSAASSAVLREGGPAAAVLDSRALEVAMACVLATGEVRSVGASGQTFDRPPDPRCAAGHFLVITMEGALPPDGAQADASFFVGDGTAEPGLTLAVAVRALRRAGGCLKLEEGVASLLLPWELPADS